MPPCCGDGGGFAVLRRRALPLALLAVAAAAVRAPNPDADPGSAIAAELLVRAAADPDLAGAWRLLQSSSFKREWLTTTGRSGETPIQAAARECRAELVGLIATHPDFDFKGFRKNRERRDLMDYVTSRGECLKQDFYWTMGVLRAVQTSRPRQEEVKEDVNLAINEEVWFLPKPGEWFPPESLEDMGLVEPEYPKLPMGELEAFVRSPSYDEVLTRAANGRVALSGGGLDLPILKRIWGLAICHLRAAPGSDERRSIERHLRSIGWGLFFRGARQAMNLNYMLISFTASRLTRADFPPCKEGEQDEFTGEVLGRYSFLVQALLVAWDRIGTWTMLA